jgi:hypothetical protein
MAGCQFQGVGARHSSPQRPNRLWAYQPLSIGHQCHFPSSTWAVSWSWPLCSMHCRGQVWSRIFTPPYVFLACCLINWAQGQICHVTLIISTVYFALQFRRWSAVFCLPVWEQRRDKYFYSQALTYKTTIVSKICRPITAFMQSALLVECICLYLNSSS